MNRRILIKELLLVFVTLLWGIAFTWQDIGSKYLDAFSFTMLRSIVACIFLYSLLLIIKLYKKKKGIKEEQYSKKQLWFGGILIGIACAIAMVAQQAGIALSGAGLSGFVTSLYILFVPIVAFILFKVKSPWYIWPCLAIAIGGLFIMNMLGNDDGNVLSIGTLYLILCAVAYAFQISLIDKYAKTCPSIELSIIQFLVISVVTGAITFIQYLMGTSSISIENIKNAAWTFICLGVFSSGIAFTIQIYVQSELHPVVASLIMSLESVFSLLFGMLILKETHTGFEILGCIMIFASIVLAEVLNSIKTTKNIKV